MHNLYRMCFLELLDGPGFIGTPTLPIQDMQLVCCKGSGGANYEACRYPSGCKEQFCRTAELFHDHGSLPFKRGGALWVALWFCPPLTANAVHNDTYADAYVRWCQANAVGKAIP